MNQKIIVTFHPPEIPSPENPFPSINSIPRPGGCGMKLPYNWKEKFDNYFIIFPIAIIKWEFYLS